MQVNRSWRIFLGASAAAAAIFGCWQLLSGPPRAAAAVAAPQIAPVGLSRPEAPQDPFARQRQALAAAAGEMAAGHIFVYDCGSGDMLYCSTGATDGLYPASVTKLFSAWVALQLLPGDSLITVGDELALVQPGSSLAYLARGQQLTADMLVEAMLLPSGNDAAYALAAAAGRQLQGAAQLTAAEAVEAFVAELNRQAQCLGLKNTRFANPDGYHHPDHSSCPEDLARMGALVLEEPSIAKYSAMAVHSPRFASGETITWYNTNRLTNPGDRFFTPDFLGGKTGYTSQAGYCLLGAFNREDRRLIIGIFGTQERQDRYVFAHGLLEALAQD